VSDLLIKRAVEVFRSGGVVVFPTDTVWGVGVVASETQAIERFYSIKEREKEKPTAVLVGDLKMAKEYGVFNEEARNLAEEYWPGGLTIIVPARKDQVSELVLGERSNVGLRVPSHKITLILTEQLGEGIVSGSANFSGDPAPGEYGDINKKFLERVDYVLWPGNGLVKGNIYESGGQLPSTVVDTTKKPFVVLREGKVRLRSGD
jgi:L-threonylcarbamoyladenylate synthase